MENENVAQQLRDAAHVPVGQLASLLGVSRQAYYKWLNGGPITPDHATHLREMLEVYRMKGWLNKAESLAWGLPHRPYEAMRDDLDRLHPAAYPVGDNEDEPFFARGFLLE